MIRLAHISDFHVRNDALFESEYLILDPLIDDLKSFHREQSVDFIVCSGDLIDRGGQSFDSPQKAFEAFEDRVAEPILAALNIGRSQFILVPGNHDVVSDLDSLITESGLATRLDSVEATNQYIKSGSTEGSKRIDPYYTFASNFYRGQEPVRQSRYESVFVFKAGNLKIGVAAFNTAWRCWPDGTSSERLLLGESQVLRTLSDLSSCDLKIAVAHHPLDRLCQYDRKVIKPHIQREFDFFLCGHDHEGSTQSTHMLGNALFVSVSPGILHQNVQNDSRRYANGYRIVDFNPTNLKITARSRRYSSDKNTFDPNTDLGDEQGIDKYQLPSTEMRARFREAQSLAERIKHQHISALDQQLLSFGNDTNAPARTKDIFVMPEVVHRRRTGSGKDGKIEDVEETQVGLENLASDHDSLLLLGKKETGKTVLLNRLLIKLANGIEGYRQIPVRINFQELGNRRIESEVNQFLGVGSHEVDRVAKEHDLTLLIDDITFEDYDERRIERLRRFLEKYPGTRIVATHRQGHSGELPMGHVADLQLKPLEIKFFKTKQLRELVGRWFSETDAVNAQSQINNVVSLFSALDIPRTPFAASILLWIIEKQEDYRPRNKAMMVENFVERLLRKHAKEEAFSGRFNYKNKLFLLAKISHVMLERGAINYRLRWSEALECCDKHLEGREWDQEFSSRSILNGLVEAGIFTFTEGGRYIQFRFPCFFEYFLAKRMEHDQEFKDSALAKENYLLFANEIEYYTGIHRSCTDILRLLSDRLNTSYASLKDHFTGDGKTYDDHLEKGASHVSALNELTALSEIEEDRPSEEDLEALQDERLEMVSTEQGIMRKERLDNPIERLSRALFLTAQVLKHTEETDEPELKKEAYQNVIQCALAYTVLYKYVLERYLTEQGDALSQEFREVADMMADYAPIVVQVGLHSHMGTRKLNGVLRSEIERNLQSDAATSDLEKFFAVFLYAENRGKNYLKQVERLIGRLQTRYMEDIVFFKLLTYLYLRSKNPKLDDRLLNLMAEVLVKAKDLPASHKGRFIQEYRKKKLVRKVRSQDESQGALDF